MVYKCFVCRKETRSDSLTFKAEANEQLVAIIEKSYKKWFLADGVCVECIYRARHEK